MDKNLLLVLVENRIHGCEHERTMSIATLNTKGTAPINRSLILHCLKTIRPRKSSRSKVKGSFQFWKNKKKKKITIWQPTSFLSFFSFYLSFHSSHLWTIEKERSMYASFKINFEIKKSQWKWFSTSFKSSNSFVSKSKREIQTKIEQIWWKLRTFFKMWTE